MPGYPPLWNGGGRKAEPGDVGRSSRKGLNSLGGLKGLPYGGRVVAEPAPLVGGGGPPFMIGDGRTPAPNDGPRSCMLICGSVCGPGGYMPACILGDGDCIFLEGV